MGVLGHYFERSGIPTTQISLVRLHTVALRPPRALWVPFALGRPLGPPGDAALQTRVLRAALELLPRHPGPVLADWPEDDPDADVQEVAWSCPVPLPPHDIAADDPAAGFAREFETILGWYALALERRGRTTVGLSSLEPPTLAEFIAAFAQGVPPSPDPDLPVAQAFKFATQDLLAIYQEAALAQPGRGRATAADIGLWFWGETKAGALLRTLRPRLMESNDPELQKIARSRLVPTAVRS